ncbi:MAG: hypothetical protein JSR55_00630 [Proteobacteria bacterium]|nr:hypothetical protein [Pseudomonadota bacterium]
MQARLEANGVAPYGVDIEPLKTFPGIVFVARSIPDAGPFFLGAFVRGKWVGGKSSASWAAVSTAAMRAMGWTRIRSRRRREMLALKWVTEAQPPGATVQTLASDPHPEAAANRIPAVKSIFAEVIVTAWITRTRTAIAGPRTDYPGGPTSYVFSRDGTVRVEGP